ncbi:VOC family protein [Nocardioides sp. WG-D5]
MSVTFGTIRQLGFVVPDLETAMRHWVERLGVGPFFHVARQPVNDFRFRGVPLAAPEFSVALAQAGHLQVELIQQHDPTPSAFQEFVDEGREGLQHIAFWTTRFDEVTAQVREQGHTEVMSGRSGSGAPDERFAYFDGGGPQGTVVEISEVSGRKRALFDAVAQAGANWDGTDPVRDMTSLVTP